MLCRLVYCIYAKHAFCKTMVVSTASGSETQVVCANKKVIKFARALKKRGYSYNFITNYEGIDYVVEPGDLPLPADHDLKAASEANGGLCNPVGILT